jgi:hypothetical protein
MAILYFKANGDVKRRTEDEGRRMNDCMSSHERKTHEKKPNHNRVPEFY